tara:strand:- start:1486 stop:2274 length:789 start_codon:yes stop_codon:yes gene_type:complete
MQETESNAACPGADRGTLDAVRIVLVNPIYGGNVGSVCRAMMNMGLTKLVLVAPRQLDMNELRMMSCSGYPIYENRTEVASLDEAIADCGMVVGTTARLGLYRSHSSTARQAAPGILQAAAERPVAILFGREDNGLSNEDLSRCTALIQIPTSETLSSLNLAQAVLLCCYELFLATDSFAPSEERSDDAPANMRDRMFDIWRETMLEIGFMQDDKADHMMMGLRRIFSRGRLTVDDVKILMGVARQAQWAARNQNKQPVETE